MKERIKKYIEYRKNKKNVKRELVKFGSTALPFLNDFSININIIIKFLIKLLNETKDLKGEQVLDLVLNELSNILQAKESRIIEILTYIASLSPQDIQKVLVHSAVETMPTDNKTE